jgi:hypothetical protein
VYLTPIPHGPNGYIKKQKVIVEPFPTLSFQQHILKLGVSFLVKGDETEKSDPVPVLKGDFSSLDDENRDEVLNRLQQMHDTFSALSDWTSLFVGLVENPKVLLKPIDFQKQFPFGSNPTTSIIGGILELQTDTRRINMNQASEKLITLNPGDFTKLQKKVRFFSGTKLLERLKSLEPKEINTFSKLWGVPGPANEEDEEAGSDV